jgi:hypothetical protein
VIPVEECTTRLLPDMLTIRRTHGATVELRYDLPTWILPGASYALAPGVRLDEDGLVDDLGRHYPLNSTGKLVCRLGREPADLDLVVDELARASGTPAPLVSRGVVGFVAELSRRGLLSIHQSFAREALVVARELPYLTVAGRHDRHLLRHGTRWPVRRYPATVTGILRSCAEAYQSVLWFGVAVAVVVLVIGLRVDTLNMVRPDTLPGTIAVLTGFFLLIPVTAVGHELGHWWAARMLQVPSAGCYSRRGAAGVTYPTAPPRAGLLITLAGPVGGLLTVTLAALVWLGVKPWWIAMRVDQLGLSIALALGVIAAMQVLALTPVARDGRELLSLWMRSRAPKETSC